GHTVLAEDVEVQRELRRRWGDDIFAPDGTIDRQAVAARVFGASAEASANRKFLEDLLHPRIQQRLEKLRDQYEAESKPAAVLDAPLLLEANWEPMCDVLLMIDTPQKLRLKHAMQRGWTEDEFARREAAQWPAERKRLASNVVIKNDGSENDLGDAVQKFWR